MESSFGGGSFIQLNGFGFYEEYIEALTLAGVNCENIIVLNNQTLTCTTGQYPFNMEDITDRNKTITGKISIIVNGQNSVCEIENDCLFTYSANPEVTPYIYIIII